MARTAPALRLLVSQDTRRQSGGYAVLSLQGASAVPGDLRLVIRRRQPPENFLGPAGWQPTTAEIEAESQERDASGTPQLLLGPAVVDRIKPYAKLEIEIPSLAQKASLIWPELRQSPEGYLPTGGIVAGGAPKLRAETSGIRPPDLRGPKPDTTEAEEPEDEEEAEALPLVAEPKTQPPLKRLRLWPWLLLLFVLLVAGGLALWQYLDQGPEKLACEWGLIDCTPPDPCPATLTPAERKECLVTNLSPEALFAVAEELGTSGVRSNRDFAWSLFALLADRGFAPAELELGLCYDPLLPEGCSLQPRLADNARQALQYYRRAEGNGATEAATHATALCDWLEPRDDLQSEAAKADFCQ